MMERANAKYKTRATHKQQSLRRIKPITATTEIPRYEQPTTAQITNKAANDKRRQIRTTKCYVTTQEPWLRRKDNMINKHNETVLGQQQAEGHAEIC